MPTLDGILNVYKPQGMTSHDVVGLVRRLSGQRRVGHAGTLDPAAEGVLLVCLGKATRVVEYLTEDRKAYRAAVTFGLSTDTYDAEGRITRHGDASGITLAAIQDALAAFRGPLMQVPPLYSAIKHSGQPLYKLARAGRAFSPPPRPVTIFALDVLDWHLPVLSLYVECSKGTYIRSLAYDLGERLGCGGHLSGLIRMASGRFSVDSSSTIDDLRSAFAAGTADELLFALDEALLDRDALIVGASRTQAIRNGMGWAAAPAATSLPVGEQGPVRVYSVEGEIVAMAEYDRLGGRWQPTKVF